MYKQKEINTALRLYDRLKSIRGTIRILGYPSRTILHRCIRERRETGKVSARFTSYRFWRGGGVRKRNQAPYEVKGYRLFDKVLCKGEEAFIFGRRSSGSFDVRKLDWRRLSAGISYKKLRLIERRKTYLTEIRQKEAALPPLPKRRCLRADFWWQPMTSSECSKRAVRKTKRLKNLKIGLEPL